MDRLTAMREGLKIRLPYIVATVVLLGIEVIIGAYVHDDFVRPFVGDALVTALLCAVGRIVLPRWRWLPLAVLLFAVAVELSQLIELDRILGVEGTAIGTAIGSTFDIADLICYAVGCVIFFTCEMALKRLNKK